MASALWPPPAKVRLDRQHCADERLLAEFVLVGSRGRASMLLPVGSRRAAAASVRRFSHGQRWSQRWGRELLSLGLLTGLAQRSLRTRLCISAAEATPGDSIVDLLTELFDTPVVVALGVGTMRANRKPVLQVMTRNGRSLGFVKVGWNDLTRPLVAAEAAALRALHQRRMSSLIVPGLLHHRQWRDFEVLVMSPLGMAPGRRQGSSNVPVAAMREVAGVDDTTEQPLRDSSFWKRLVSYAEEMSADDPAANQMSTILAAADSTAGGTVLKFGAWHGDWTPWNMSWRGSAPQVWDWERFDREVPVGFDALHYRLQQLHKLGRMPLADAATQWAEEVTDLLRPFGVEPADARLHAPLYLLELFRRYHADSSSEMGSQLRIKAVTLLQIAANHVAALPAAPGAQRRTP